MEKMIEALLNTKEIVMVNISEPGVNFTFNGRIVSSESYLDGVTLFFDDENELFISTAVNTLVNIDPSGDSTEYTIVTPTKSIITILVVN